MIENHQHVAVTNNYVNGPQRRKVNYNVNAILQKDDEKMNYMALIRHYPVAMKKNLAVILAPPPLNFIHECDFYFLPFEHIIDCHF